MRRLAVAAAIVLASGSALAGCAAAPEISDDVAGSLQSSVRLVAEHASGGDPAAAVAELDALEQRVDAAVESGDVSGKRSEAIDDGIALVRSDLERQIADAEAEAQAAKDRAAAEQAEADRLAAEQEAKENDRPGKGPKKDDEGDE